MVGNPLVYCGGGATSGRKHPSGYLGMQETVEFNRVCIEKGFRGSLLLDMVLLRGFVTNFVAGKERFAYSLLILAVIDVLATLIPVKSGL